MSTTTAIFKEPKHFPAGDPHDMVVHTLPHDPENKAIEDVHRFIPGHQPMNEKMITT